MAQIHPIGVEKKLFPKDVDKTPEFKEVSSLINEMKINLKAIHNLNELNRMFKLEADKKLMYLKMVELK
jgi:hypothetical protein